MRAKVVSSADDGAAWNHLSPLVITILCVLMLRAQFLQTHCVFSIYDQPDFGPRPFLGFPVPCWQHREVPHFLYKESTSPTGVARLFGILSFAMLMALWPWPT